MSGLDYTFVQELIDFGRGFAAEMVGQPFMQYRVGSRSNFDVLDPVNKIKEDLRAKVTHNRSIQQLENEYIHSNPFEFMLDSNEVRVGDILVQNDREYGANTYYAVASRRPLKKVLCVRVESLCTLYRPQESDADGYGGATRSEDAPFVLRNGELVLGTKADTAAVIPCGIQNIGQMKNQKPEHLPMSTTTSWWYVYVPAIKGFERLRENDVIVHQVHPDELPVRYRINQPYASKVGTAGQFLLCERLTS